ncbi:hypothetical protein NB037_06840 [Rathayibacter sp. ZW T2_19]|uniref:Uncharacterized protein n=1 Tax=Rathayibacter rubneri TaxID=2950106 RepID=A0A9X2IS02_9MICO|nr:hypothetical protein [Rathayibacter rubneri]MCM6762131.1 hypothetical protein [Rathayibacter rubneri]
MTRAVLRRPIAAALGAADRAGHRRTTDGSAIRQEVPGYYVDDAVHILVVLNPTRRRLLLRLAVHHVPFPESAPAAPYRIAGVTGVIARAHGRDVASYDLGVVPVPAQGSWVGTIEPVRAQGAVSFLPSVHSLAHRILLTAALPSGAGAPVARSGPIVSTAYLPSASAAPTVVDLPG